MGHRRHLVGAALVIAGCVAFSMAAIGCAGSSDEPGLFQQSLEKAEAREDRLAHREAHLPSTICKDHGLSHVCRIAATTFGARNVEQVLALPDPESFEGDMAVAYGFRLAGLEPAYAVSLAMKSEAVEAFRRTFRAIPKEQLSYVEVAAYAPEGRRVFDAAVRSSEVNGDPLNAMQVAEIDSALAEP